MISFDKNALQLYLVTDEKACLGRDLFQVVEEAVRGGVTMVQLREKALPTRAFIDRAKKMKDLLAPWRVPLIINDRVDVALAADADGVHVGQSDMPFEILKEMLPEGKIIGLSAENRQNVVHAEQLDVSYLAVSPLYATSTKTDTEKPWELEGLDWVRRNSRHPLVCIGGIHAFNAGEILKGGPVGLAVISAICSAASPFVAARELKNIITLAVDFPADN